MTMKETGTCCICGGTYIHMGNNPDPFDDVNSGERCCHDCDNRFVTPARLFGITFDSHKTLKLQLKLFAKKGREMVAMMAMARNLHVVTNTIEGDGIGQEK